MKIYHSLETAPPPDPGCVLSIGNFDGVHIGHQAILQHARQIAAVENLPFLVMTFQPAPAQVLNPTHTPRLLTPPDLKIALFRRQNIDQLVIARADPELFSLSPEEFVQKILLDRLRVRHVVEGQTFSFGRRRSGTALSLAELGQKHDFQTHMIPSQLVTLSKGNVVAVSSTLIRQQVMTCEFSDARHCLGRWYALYGQVVPGRGKGRQLGFPTANLKLHDPCQLVPEDGIFAGVVRLGDNLEQVCNSPEYFPAAINIGRSHTFDQSDWLIEAHLLDFSCLPDDLYGKHILLTPVERLRNQQRFPAEKDLIQAINSDCTHVREVLKLSPIP